MEHRLKLCLDFLRADYREVSGKDFKYFWCPILASDEMSELCAGHVVNQAFPNRDRVERAWVVQRKDVDNFYGTYFEADFVTLKYAETLITDNVFIDKDMFNKLQPRILLDGEEVKSFVSNGAIPLNMSRVKVGEGDNSINLGLKLTPSQMMHLANAHWQIEVSKDLRLSALVSLIKAGHLTLFKLFNYRYALTTAGYFIGHDLLGRFFLENKGHTKNTILNNAKIFFQECVHMVRPAITLNMSLLGSVNDKTFLVCRNYSGLFWAFVVFVKTGHSLSAVLMPLSENADAIATYHQFLNNKQETIQAHFCRLTEKGLEMEREAQELMWMKDIDTKFD